MKSAIQNLDDALLDALRTHALRYLLDEVDPGTGLVADSTIPGTVCSIAAVGMALACTPSPWSTD